LYDAAYLRLLEHDLAHEDGVRVARVPPRQVACIGREPREQALLRRVAQRRRRSSTSKIPWSTQLTMVMMSVAQMADMKESRSKPETIQLVM
jgi:hypothetical protein